MDYLLWMYFVAFVCHWLSLFVLFMQLQNILVVLATQCGLILCCICDALQFVGSVSLSHSKLLNSFLRVLFADSLASCKFLA